MFTETTRLSDPAAIGTWIRTNRRSRGWTLEQLASRAGTGVRFVSECERGKASAELGKVLAVLRALGLDLVAGQGSAPSATASTPDGAQTAGQETTAVLPGKGMEQRPAERGDAARLWDMLMVAAEIGALPMADAGNGIAPPVPDVARRRALERCFEVLGEAARRVTPATQERLARVPWRDLVARRNRLVMEYERDHEAELWRAAREEIPALLETLRGIVVPGDADPPGQ